MAETAHSFGASIEAELGHVGIMKEEALKEAALGPNRRSFTRIRSRRGTSLTGPGRCTGHCRGHGPWSYKLPPKLDFDRIVKIKELTGLPLVMHGGSGISVADTQRAIRCGIRKINYFSYMSNAGVKAVKKLLEEKKSNTSMIG